jgi:uncharacterized damage-inducible protein DinB
MSHHDRIAAQQTAFSAAMKQFEDTVSRLDEGAATQAPAGGGWTAAQIAWHVGQTNELLAGVLSGQVPMATPAPEGFAENPNVFGGVPSKVQTFPQLEPPAGTSRADGLAKLKASAQPYLQSLQALSAERASGYCVDFSFGKLSLYQLADFTAAHVMRHQQQIQRATTGV